MYKLSNLESRWSKFLNSIQTLVLLILLSSLLLPTRVFLHLHHHCAFSGLALKNTFQFFHRSQDSRMSDRREKASKFSGFLTVV